MFSFLSKSQHFKEIVKLKQQLDNQEEIMRPALRNRFPFNSFLNKTLN